MGTPASRRQAWRVLLPAGTAMVLSLAGDLTLYAVLPVYAAGLGFSLASLGLLLSANRLVRLVSNPLTGLLADRAPRRRLVLAGLACGMLATLLYPAAGGLAVFLLGRLLWGVSWSFIYIGVLVMLLDVTPPEEHGWGSGMLHAFYYAGLAAAPLAGGLLSDLLGFTRALLVCAGIQGLGLLVAALFLPETRPARAAGSEQAFTPGGLRGALRAGLSWLGSVSWAKLAHNREIAGANYLNMLVLFVGEGIIMSTVTYSLQQRYGEAALVLGTPLPVASLGGALLALRAVVAAATAPLAGFLSDRPGRLRPDRSPGEETAPAGSPVDPRTGRRWRVAGWGVLLSLLGCLLLAAGGPVGLAAAGIALAALGSGAVHAVLPAIVSRSEGRGAAMGLLATSGDLGSAIAPLAGYSLLSTLSLPGLYLVSAALLATGLAAAVSASRSGLLDYRR